MTCKNLFSYPDGTIFTGSEILAFINYHVNNKTGKTKIARYMQRKFGNVKPNEQYKFFRKWICYDTTVDKPRLLRVDHTSPIIKEYNYFTDTYTFFRYEGCKSIKIV